MIRRWETRRPGEPRNKFGAVMLFANKHHRNSVVMSLMMKASVAEQLPGFSFVSTRYEMLRDTMCIARIRGGHAIILTSPRTLQRGWSIQMIPSLFRSFILGETKLLSEVEPMDWAYRIEHVNDMGNLIEKVGGTSGGTRGTNLRDCLRMEMPDVMSGYLKDKGE